MAIHIIVAMTKDRVIGRNNAIPWHIKEDMRLFRELTANNAVIMGRSTWLSLPERSRPLPGRTNIIVSKTLPEQKGATVCRSVKEAVETAEKEAKDVFCIGGAQVYAVMLPLAQVLHVSRVKKQYDGDAYFPEVDFSEWEEQETRDFADFTYTRYIRKAQ